MTCLEIDLPINELLPMTLAYTDAIGNSLWVSKQERKLTTKKIGILMKNDERTHEIGTDEYREYLQQNTPQQEVEKYVNEAQKKMNSEKKKHFSQVFQNPLKGFPYNEEFEVTEKDLSENIVSELFANPDATEEDRLSQEL